MLIISYHHIGGRDISVKYIMVDHQLKTAQKFEMANQWATVWVSNQSNK